MTATSSTIMQVAPASKAGMVASTEEVSYELGGATGVALMGSLLSFAYSATFMLPAAFVWTTRHNKQHRHQAADL
ncbi:hypothetical protein [Pectobacterium sp. CFBP8739]|uniref:hypothetical protein n=1 Tax=Pectobacterium sp. CFBP8739 TaxID=2748908 RepID=UPI0021035FA5|nr:hypothetical protein [Pectobacterium sp. CFBP8739]